MRSDTRAIVIIDTVHYHPDTSSLDTSKDIQSLACVLSKVDPISCSLLACEGVKRNPAENGESANNSFIFQLSPDWDVSANLFQHPGRLDTDSAVYSNISSLRDLLLGDSGSVSITYRLKIARSMARSIISIHSAAFVHKNVRPETVLTSPSGSSYLVGFQRFRAADGFTRRLGDALWQHDIYRHPMRQGEAPEEAYKMQHDIYSLGVCLLEIGLWTSFVKYENDEMVTCGLPELVAVPSMQNLRKRAFAVKKVYAHIATKRLPSCMGDKYSKVVVSCLTCLDKGGSFEVTNDLDEGDGIQIGVRYLEQILNELEDISM